MLHTNQQTRTWIFKPESQMGQNCKDEPGNNWKLNLDKTLSQTRPELGAKSGKTM